MAKYNIEYYSSSGYLLGEQTVEFEGFIDAEQKMEALLKNHTTIKITSNDKNGNATLEEIAIKHIAKIKLTEHR